MHPWSDFITLSLLIRLSHERDRLPEEHRRLLDEQMTRAKALEGRVVHDLSVRQFPRYSSLFWIFVASHNCREHRVICGFLLTLSWYERQFSQRFIPLSSIKYFIIISKGSLLDRERSLKAEETRRFATLESRARESAEDISRAKMRAEIELVEDRW